MAMSRCISFPGSYVRLDCPEAPDFDVLRLSNTQWSLILDPCPEEGR